jgi:DNA invertase Pin-like site-specific DNA recombinase
MKLKIKAYSYIRFSTPEQSKGHSLERQLEKARLFAGKNGWELDKSLTDKGISAFTGENIHAGKLGNFLRLIKKGEIKKGSVLIVESLDRLSRQNYLIALNMFLEIVQAGISIASLIDEKIYTNELIKKDSFSLIQCLMSFIIANEESEKKSIRVKDAWKRKKEMISEKKGLYTRMLPFWLSWDDENNNFNINKIKYQTIKKIFILAKKGYGKSKICKLINSERIPPFRVFKNNRKPNGWHPSVIAKLLSNRSLIGEFVPHKVENVVIDGKYLKRRVQDGVPIRDYFPKVIDEKVFLDIQRKNKFNVVKGGRQTLNNIFTGIIKCGYCGSSIVYVNKGQDKYLVCGNAKRGLDCTYSSLKYVDFERWILGYCTNINFAELLNSNQNEIEFKNDKEKIEFIDDKIEQNEREMNGLISDVGKIDNKHAKSKYIERINTLGNEIESWKKDKIEKEKKISSVVDFNNYAHKSILSIKQLYDTINRSNNAKKYDIKCKIRQSIQELIEKIIIYPLGTNYKQGKELIEVENKISKNILPFKTRIPLSTEFGISSNIQSQLASYFPENVRHQLQMPSLIDANSERSMMLKNALKEARGSKDFCIIKVIFRNKSEKDMYFSKNYENYFRGVSHPTAKNVV